MFTALFVRSTRLLFCLILNICLLSSSFLMCLLPVASVWVRPTGVAQGRTQRQYARPYASLDVSASTSLVHYGRALCSRTLLSDDAYSLAIDIVLSCFSAQTIQVLTQYWEAVAGSGQPQSVDAMRLQVAERQNMVGRCRRKVKKQ